MAIPHPIFSSSAALAIRALRFALKWLGTVAAILFWIGAGVWLFMELTFGPGVTAPPPMRSPDDHHLLYSSVRDPGAFGREHTSFGLWREDGDRQLIAYLDLAAADDVKAIQTHWIDGASIELRNVPVSSVRSIHRAGDTSKARMIVLFKEE